ncbi:MAG: transposase [Candidatus Diapherotrites archaeon]|uniref:Transposase n=1 Tax=Candidatus Iainarchaeum sp. TaxID=3101447 RepID=A0A8T4L6H5_9ARCH|nr:transposase [Candidatus Diapherotrites archaeon]
MLHRAIKIRLGYDKRLVDTIYTYNSACNFVLQTAFNAKTYNKTRVHHLTYKKVREMFPALKSNLVCAARNQACAMLKRQKLKCLPIVKKAGSIRYVTFTFTPQFKKGVISLSTIYGRVKVPIRVPLYFHQYIHWVITFATLSFKQGHLFLHLNAKKESPSKLPPKNLVGIDRGIINPLVTSTGQFFNSRKLRNVKARYQWLKKCLQSKGTRSAKRHLKRLSGREKRFVTDVNHCLSKRLVQSEADTFVLEKLHIKPAKSNGPLFNTLLGGWSFGQLLNFLRYKSEGVRKNVLLVPSKYTSQECSICGYVEKSNRKGALFRCKKCLHSLNADLNAARNIAQRGKTLLSRLRVDQPIVAQPITIGATSFAVKPSTYPY